MASLKDVHEVDGSCVHKELIGLVSLHGMGEYALSRRTVTKQDVREGQSLRLLMSPQHVPAAQLRPGDINQYNVSDDER